MFSLCCISNELKPTHSFQTMTWKRFNDLGAGELALKELSARWLNNVKVTHRIIQHCAENGWNYRVSSSLFPILTHPEFPYKFHDAPDFEAILDEFRAIQNARYPVRLSTHPDPFNVLASRNEFSLTKTKNELEHHAWMMDLLGCERSYQNPINIHVNCSDGEPWEIADRFAANLATLSPGVRSRLVVENEDKGIWNVERLVKYFYNRHGIGVTLDTLHHTTNGSQFDEYQAMQECAKTWGHIKPLFHYCEAMPDQPNPRKHADMPTDCPPDFPADWEIELKNKCFAIRRLEEIRNSRLLKGCPSPIEVVS
jgi:UV DNA damage endonuclease